MKPESIIPKRVLVCTLLFIHGLLLVFPVFRDAITMQEVAAIPAGIHHWRTGDLSVFRVNPPLLRMWATLPLLPLNPQVETVYLPKNMYERVDWQLGANFLERNGATTLRYVQIARLMCVPIMLWGAWVCFLWSRTLFGFRGGLLSLTLWTFEPWFLGHGHTIAGDTAAACFALTFGWQFRSWLIDRTMSSAVAAGIAMAVAILCKTTCIVLVVVSCVLWCLHVRKSTWKADLAQLAMGMITMLLLINASYGFSGSFSTLGSFRFISQELSGRVIVPTKQGPTEGNRFHGSFLGRLPIPLPFDFVTGIDLQKWDMQRERWSFLRDQWRTSGWPHYYLYGVLIKTPLGTIGLVTVSFLICCFRCSKIPFREELQLLLPSLTIFLLITAEQGLNRHVRYVMPMFPFMFVMLGCTVASRRAALWRCVGIAVAATIGSSLWCYPHHLSYFNESMGGPMRGYMHLEDSNIEWGQDLTYVRRWMEQHPDARPMFVSSYQHEDRTLIGAGVNSDGNPFLYQQVSPNKSGYYWLAINVMSHIDRQATYRAFRDIPPFDCAGYSYRIYRLKLDELNKFRTDAKLPPWELK